MGIPEHRVDGQPPVELVEFIDANYGAVLNALAYHLQDTELAKDLTQETLVRLCAMWDRVQAHPDPVAWLFKVAFNLGRSAQRRNRTAFVKRPPLKAEVDEISSIERTISVEEALSRLPNRLREIVILRYYVDLTERQIASVLRIPLGTVKTRHRKALSELRQAPQIARSHDG